MHHKITYKAIPHLFMQMTDPLSKLSSIGDRGRQKDVMDIVRKQDDRLLPNHAPVWLDRTHEGDYTDQMTIHIAKFTNIYIFHFCKKRLTMIITKAQV